MVSVTFLLFLLELLHTGERSSFLPAPSSVAKAFSDMYHDGLLVTSVIESLSRVFYGFSAALLVGLSIGYGMGSYPRFKDAVVLPLEMLRPIPPIAWIPLAIIVFGISNLSAYFVIFIGALFPILTNTELGVRQVRGGYIEAAKIYGASDLNLLRHIVLPSALPSIFSGIVIGLGFSWMVVVAAEMVAANSGLGYQIQLDRQLLRLDRVIAGMVTIGVLGYIIISAVKMLEWYSLPWLHVRGTDRRKTENHNVEKEIDMLEDDGRFSFYVGGSKLDIKGLYFSYSGNEYIIRDLSLKVEHGEIIAILGESGSGKTTLLRLLAGLEKPSKGALKLDDIDISDRCAYVSMLFQNLELFPWKKIHRNISFPLEMSGETNNHIDAAVKGLLRLVGLENKASMYPPQLSGGQQQRVALARALAAKPQLLLMDEPFSGLDMDTRERLQDEFHQILRASGTTVVMVTHDIHEACAMADRIFLLKQNINGMLISFDNGAKQQKISSAVDRTSMAFHELSDKIRENMKNL